MSTFAMGPSLNVVWFNKFLTNLMASLQLSSSSLQALNGHDLRESRWLKAQNRNSDIFERFKRFFVIMPQLCSLGDFLIQLGHRLPI